MNWRFHGFWNAILTDSPTGITGAIVTVDKGKYLCVEVYLIFYDKWYMKHRGGQSLWSIWWYDEKD